MALPKGGGAIRGIGEKFTANPVTGTGSMTVPIVTSPGRSGSEPALSLSYDSGSGNGIFGFGWSLALPSITRRTDRGLPAYHDQQESDVFLLSEAEDLVPLLGPDGGYLDDTSIDPRYVVRRYRPRVDGLFARIERWTHRHDGAVHWRSITKDNILTMYGQDAESRIADPDDAARTFTWLICETRDDVGNVVRYRYLPDNGLGVDLTQACERNRGPRDDARRSTNMYLKRIEYGNRRPLLDDAGRRPRFLADLPPEQTTSAEFMFEVVFDYGEHDPDSPTPHDLGAWTFRKDAFSSYRAGFEVRTTRLCRRILTFHHIPDGPGGENGYDGLARSTDLTYSGLEDAGSGYAFLRSATQTGYRRLDDGYRRLSLPPLEFDYSQPTGPRLVRDIDQAAWANLPVGVDSAAYQWVDLRGEGVAGILTEQADAWFYIRNLSPSEAGTVRFAPTEPVTTRPGPGLDGGRAQFMDLAGDGLPDLVVLDGPAPGLYEHDDADGWQPFRTFGSRLNRALNGDDVRLVDLNGDGHADVLTIEEDAFLWHPSLAEVGFGPPLRTTQPLDEEAGPRLVFADGTQSIYLADFSGDGLADLARIRNTEICYWPNLGYGRFGAKVTMDGLLPLDDTDQFDQRRVRLADIDGTGTADLVYLHHEGVRIYLNQSGNRWSPAQHLDAFPPVDDVVSIHIADVLGNGTACLIWSSPLPGDAGRQMRYVPLAGDQKPHLLVRTSNNLGAETIIGYAPSTKFSLLDERNGEPWATRLPFPVHVVEQVQTLDRVSRNRFVTRYAYHHGHFDGDEREFRGFGTVDQWDTEELRALAGAESAADNEHPASRMAPVRTRTWFHTGAPPGSNHLPPGSLTPPPMPAGLTAQEGREAHRALKGAMLRQEIYALDGSPRQEHPYSVVEHSFAVRLEQRRGVNQHAVFSSHPAESIGRHHERDPDDPRAEHSITLETDPFGNVLKSVAIAYGRRWPSPLPFDTDRACQTTALLTYTENALAGPIADPSAFPDDHRTPLPAETRVFELTGYLASGPDDRYSAQDFVEPDPASPRLRPIYDKEIGYQETAAGNRTRRLIEWTRELYRADDLSSFLPVGVLQPRALHGESYSLALTAELLDQVFRRDGAALLPEPETVLQGPGDDRGGYLQGRQLVADGRFPATDPEGLWWVPSGQVFLSPGPDDEAAEELRYARGHFFLPSRTRDPFHSSETSTQGFIRYDRHDLLVVETADALGNRVTVGERLPNGDIDLTKPGHDYRVLQPSQVTDANGNRTWAAFDALGLVVATAVGGKPAENLGDSLAGLDPDLSEAQITALMNSPLADPRAVLGRATTRLVHDFFAYQRTADQPDPQPAAVCVLARETHDADLAGETPTKVQLSFSYSDGLGRVIQQKLRAEPGPMVEDGPALDPRWVGSGWTVFNNKGLPVRRFEPFFSPTHRFEFAVQAGVSPVLFYDPLGRVVATLHPDHSYEKSVFDSWQHVTWDRNDTVLDDPRTDQDIAGFVAPYFAHLPTGSGSPVWQTWYEQRATGDLGPEERSAAAKAAAHARTPSTAHADVLGRPFLSIADNGPDPDHPERRLLLATRTKFDIEGNQRAVQDAVDQTGDGQGRVVMRSHYDLLGRQIHRHSMDSGARWMINDVLGRPLRAWNQRGHRFRTAYDPLRRPLRTFVLGTDPENPDLEVLVERLVYGEQHPQAAARNLRGVVHLQLDQAGAVQTEAHDFKGNPLRTSRRLTNGSRYRTTVDWHAVDTDLAALPALATAVIDQAALERALATTLEPDSYTASTTYDALDRPVTMTTPHTPAMAASVVRPGYNEANLIESLDVNLHAAAAGGQETWTPYVTGIDYDALGRRRQIDYGNGARTSYTFDPHTLRLTRLRTTRAPSDIPGEGQVQDLNYVFDPVGNVVHVRDDAQQRVFFANQVVEPSADYTYDAIYRLTEATGREHLGQNGAPIPYSADDSLRTRLPHPGDGGAMGTYTERYVYDGAGNITTMRHTSGSRAPGWTRRYEYAEASALDTAAPTTLSNRLTSTATARGDAPPDERYRYDAHGNMTRMPHLRGADPDPNVFWDHFDQMRRADPAAGGTAYFVYDADGERIRKVWEKSAGVTEERIYLGGFEIYRRTQGNETLERETLHVMNKAERVALVETRTRDTAGADTAPAQLTRFQFGNHLGSACLELDDRARILSYEEYTPYGSTSYQAMASQTETPKRFRLAGRERDEESGLNHHTARYYAPWLGRWASCDPLGMTDGLNPYCYVHDDPIGMVDPAGTEGTPILTPSGQPTPLTWIDPDSAARTSGIPPASLSGPSSITMKPAKPAFAPVPGALEPAPPPPPKPQSALREFEPKVSDPEALRRAEGMGHIERGDIVQFGKGPVNGPSSWVGGPQFAIDERYAGAAEAGKELGKDLVLEVATAGVGKALEVATPFLNKAVRAPAFAFVGAGGPGATVGTGRGLARAGETAAESRAALSAVRPDVPTHAIIPIDRIGTRAGKAYAPKVNPRPGSYRGITPNMRREAQRVGERWQGPGKYDVGHRTPLSQVPPGERVRLRSEAVSTNRADGDAIARTNELRRKAGLYTR
ncbi:RHS repeat-associated protein [Actinacidiphila cocklensis]|uniref:RHS repeat-associated protein n=1 Tax=Actinacidiphila cocklensis TaxID=887465 RepID=A0A9W4DU72_9ACTN|nr:RHS repeat-associated protein [Actinacidiphila cocklensis]